MIKELIHDPIFPAGKSELNTGVVKLVYKRDFFDISVMKPGARLFTTITCDGTVVFKEYRPGSRKAHSVYKGKCSIEDYEALCERIENCILDCEYYENNKRKYSTEERNEIRGEIKEITTSEEKNREIVTKLKSKYREIFVKYNNSKEDYEMISSAIELQFENVDKLFLYYKKVNFLCCQHIRFLNILSSRSEIT